MSDLADLLGRSARYLRTAERTLDDGDAESSVSRSYYAMFFAAEAALLSKGLTYSSHRGLLVGFGEHFVKPGILPAKLGRDLKEALEARLRGDYAFTATIDADAARSILVQAREFVAAIRSHLGEA